MTVAQHDHGVSDGTVLLGGPVWLRALVLLAFVIVLAAALLRPIARPGRGGRVVIASAGTVAVAGELVIAAADPALPRRVDLAVVGTLPVMLVVSAVVFTVFLDGFSQSMAAWIAGIVAVLAVVGLVRSVVGGLLIAVAALTWTAIAQPRKLGWVVNGQAILLVIAVLAGATQLAVVQPERAVARVPQIRPVVLGADTVRILVVPQRAGWNLVRVPETGVQVGSALTPPITATPRPGTTGHWALIRLPEGASRLSVRRGNEHAQIGVEAGPAGHSPDLSGPDGAECADSALGGLIAGGTVPMAGCPSDHLVPDDAAALRAMVAFLATRGYRSITVISDSSPRSRAAIDVVRAAGQRYRITTDGPGPVLIIAGWTAAHAALTKVASGELPGPGSYLAPWLFTGPLLSMPAGQLIPLRSSPGDESTTRYLTTLQQQLPGATATMSGYKAWRAQPDNATLRLFAASAVNVGLTGPGHRHDATTWFPGGAVIPVSGELSAS